MGEPAKYPGWEKFNDQLQGLLKGVNKDDIPLDGKLPRPVRKDALARALRKEANGVPAGERCDCGVPTKDALVNALGNPDGKDYDWTPWSGHWKGKWWAPGKAASDVPADWLKPEIKASTGPKSEARDAESMSGVPPEAANVRKQEVVFRKAGQEVDRRGWNVSDGEHRFVWGWDPKDFGSEWKKGVHVGLPFTNGKCRCIIWLNAVNAYLECLSEDKKCYSIVALDGHGKLAREGDAKAAK